MKKTLFTLSISLLCAIAGISQNLDSGLVLHYPFNGSANDISGNNYHGSVNGATLDSNRFGQPNSAYYFDGQDDYIAVTGSKDILNVYSVAVWFKTKTLNWGSSWKVGIIFSGNRAGTNRLGRPNIHLEEDGSCRVTGGYPGGCCYPEVTKIGNYGEGKWHLAVANFVDSSDVFEFYVDGQYVGVDSGKMVRPLYMENEGTKNNMVTLGWRNGNNQFYEGNIDDLRIYNRLLSATEVRWLYLEGNCKDYINRDTLGIAVADTLFKPMISGIYLANSRHFKTRGGCDSVIESYHHFVYRTVVCSDSVTVYDTLLVNDSVVVFDTVMIMDTTRISVTDTLLIDLTTLGINGDKENRMQVYPNPTSGQLIIDNGNYSLMDQWRISITNTTNQTVFASVVNQQQFTVDLSNFGGKGLYFLELYNPSNQLIERRKIILK